MNNTITAHNGSEVYVSRIHEVADEYIDQLDDSKDIENAAIFRGLLKSIYLQVFKADTSMPHNARTIIDLGDIALLDDLWEIFAQLCYRYKHLPSLGKFGLMIGVNPHSFSNWSQQTYRVNTEHLASVKRWLSEAESSLEDRAVESNSIGSIFALKAAHQWRETAPLEATQTIPENTQHSPEEIAALYNNVELLNQTNEDDDFLLEIGDEI